MVIFVFIFFLLLALLANSPLHPPFTHPLMTFQKCFRLSDPLSELFCSSPSPQQEGMPHSITTVLKTLLVEGRVSCS